MDIQLSEFGPLTPEIFVLSMACLVLLVDLFFGDKNRGYTYGLSLLTLAGAAMLTYGQASEAAVPVLSGTFVNDEMSKLLKMFIYLVTGGVLIYSRQYLIDRQIYRGEFFTLALFGVLGMMVLVSAHNFITIYLGLELLSLALYALVAMQRDSIAATEAAMKYFVLGALASGMLLYGISMLYGATGSLDIATVAGTIATAGSTDLVLVLGVVFVIVGLAFKLGAVPFHMWVPDVYHGAPTAITLYIATAPKIAAFAMVMRLLAEGLGDLHGHWQDLLVMLAVLSMGIGNIVAIAQGNLKRMLAYSTIAHVGYLFLGILAGTPEGYSAAMFYIIVYALMSLGGFGMIILLSRAGFEADRLEDFKGLNERSPWFAAMMLLLMFSMAGVPPTVGFYAKLSVLQAVVASDMVWLAIVAIVFSVIGAFYYLRVLKYIYFDKAEDKEPLQAPFEMRAALSANGLAVLALGLFPGALMGMCAAALGG
jgi:NADH-quinone oxidoreductase subunit N